MFLFSSKERMILWVS